MVRHTPGANAPFSWIGERPKAKALGYLDAEVSVPGCRVLGLDAEAWEPDAESYLLRHGAGGYMLGGRFVLGVAGC
jgi:hypothetical protein